MKIKTKLCAFLLMLCAVMFSQALAESASFEPIVRLTEEGGTHAAAFLLEARDSACPMPAGSISLQKTLLLKGAGSAGFGEIRFDAPGLYAYTVRQIGSGQAGDSYDKTVYHLRVTAYRTEAGGMAINVVLNGDGDAKSEALVFHNIHPSGHTSGGASHSAKTGVEDHWMWYFAGCVALICATFFVIRVLLKDDEDE